MKALGCTPELSLHPTVPPRALWPYLKAPEWETQELRELGLLFVPIPCGLYPGFSLKCIKDQKVPIGVTVVVAALLLTIIALAVKKCPSCPSCPSHVLPSCLENGIGYREKCFYFIEAEAEWNRSQTSCVPLGARLATIDSWEELRFLLRYGRSLHYWIGLQREDSGPWKWVNGSLFNNLFDVRGKGQCAYINQDGISSDWCSQTKFSVCSHRQNRPSAIQEDSEILPSFT